ncbi:hypothetical protein C6P45_004300 [Maudiozyma exigua]|uniref:Reverse transcriptase Ty1/copia-type domain-containing protein n=1 Tax=Maudiozyma exigua TaxID=34358 RepID=A0A9P6WBZ8_MAUEX|nr:hypothetical protein C6P45_004300 [Kazachstania exigua]
MALNRPPSSSLKNNESITKFPTPSYQYYQDKEQLLNVQPDHARDPITRASFGGFIVYYDNFLIYWRSKCSQIICTSSTHSELQAAYVAVNETRWLYQITQELRKLIGLAPLMARHLYHDNTNTMKILEADFFNIKNWDVKYKYLHQLVAKKTLSYIINQQLTLSLISSPNRKKQRHSKNMDHRCNYIIK